MLPGAPTPSVPTTAGAGRVAVSILIPNTDATSADTRSPAYVAPGTAAVKITLLSVDKKPAAAAAQGPFAIGPTAAGCKAVSGGTSCAFAVDAPVGDDTFLVQTYSTASAAAGSELATGMTSVKVALNTANAAGLSLTGPIANVAITTDASSLSSSASARRAAAVTTSTLHVFVLATDAAGNTVLTPANYDVPITVALHLNGLPPGLVTLSVVYGNPLPGGPAGMSTQDDGGTITVLGPRDIITMSLNGGNGLGQPLLGAQYTPKLGPNAGKPQTTAPVPLTVKSGIILGLAVQFGGTLVVSQPATYQLVVSNGGADPSSGPITLTETLPASLTYASATGTNWTCGAVAQAVTCTTNDSVAAGASAPPVTLVVTPSAGALPSVTTTATVSGGGSDAAVASNTAGAGTSALAIASSHTGNFVANTSGTYRLSVTNAGNVPVPNSGRLTVTDTLPSGLTYVSAGGTGWSCAAVGQIVTCTSSTPVAASATAAPITLTVMPSAAASAVASVTNTASTNDGVIASTAGTDVTIVQGPLTLNPTSLEIGCVQTCQGSVAITENNLGTGTVTASLDPVTCGSGGTALVTVGTASIAGPGSFVFTGGVGPTGAMPCQVTISDGVQSLVLPVSVDALNVTVQGHRR